MESNLLKELGKIAGLAGIALGIFLLLFKGVLEKQFLPSAGLSSSQAFAVILALMILTFGIAVIGVIGWLVGRSPLTDGPVPRSTLALLAALLVIVLAAVVYVGAQAKSESTAKDLTTEIVKPEAKPDVKPEVKPDTPAPVTVTYRICSGEYEKACHQHDAYVYCYTDISAWANARCTTSSLSRIETYGGNKCGYSIDLVVCNGPK